MARILPCFLFLLAFPLADVTYSSHAQAMNLFRSSEKQFTDITPFTKWTGVLKRQPKHFKKLEAKCGANKDCKKRDWEAMLERAKGKSRTEQLKMVNAYLNASPYIQDIANWGMEDYWETLFEFFTRNGDCEDYSIAKYVSLKRLGFDKDQMRIVILRDNNLRIMHAVLAVREGGNTYILDNQIKQVLQDTRIRHYEPIYSINEYAWWRHLPR